MTDSAIGLVIALLVAAVPLVALARRVDVSYPIVLVLGGTALGFVPGLPRVALDPDVVLLIFLPPLLYWEAIIAPTDVMAENAPQIALLAVGLVAATTVAVAAAAHAIVPGLSWGMAFVLGAIVSPTDALASGPVLQHFRLPRQLIAIVDGESLLNDATALVIYGAALAVVTSGIFQPAHAALHFVVTVVGSLALGLVAGGFCALLWRHIRDASLQGVIAVILPFAAYAPAQRLGLSGVLAVVTAGVYVNHVGPRIIVPAARTQIGGFWETLVFLANAVLFLVVGLQLHAVALAAFAHHSWQTVVGYSLVVNVVLIAVRLALAVLAEFAPTPAPADHAAPNWKNALVVAWSGLRGAVSLAAALAIPLALPGGAPVANRELVIFITFSTILVTLVGGGLTLPAVVRMLRIERGTEEADELRLAQLRAAEAALARIGELEADGRIDAEHAASARTKFEHVRDVNRAEDAASGTGHVAHHHEIERELIDAQRAAVIALRERGEIDNVVMRRVQADLDAALGRLVVKD